MLSDAELLEYSKVHVVYEFVMLRQTTTQLVGRSPAFLTSVLVESFGIHLRNLICFLFDQGQQDDVVARHFFDDPTTWAPVLTQTLANARVRANKEISHLTEQRKDDKDPSKPWKHVALWDEILAIGRDFAAKASGAKLHPSLGDFLSDAAKMSAWVRANAIYSNSTATVSSFSSMMVGSPVSSVTLGRKESGK